MIKQITTQLENQEWYKSMVEECQAIIVEGVFRSRMELIETYHHLGKRILEENNNFERQKIYGERLCHAVAQSLGKSDRTIWRSIQFVKKFPNLEEWIGGIAEGKNISWHKIIQIYLPEPKEKQIELPEGKYQVILADPPWPYPKREDAKNLYGNTDYHYETIDIKTLCEMKVEELASENSVLFIWVATNFLEESFDVIKSWGFDYKSQMVWVKNGGQGGIGWYFWGDHELLLVATKGSYLPKEKVSSVLEVSRRKHSQKPEEVYKIIEKMYPKSKKIELFARQKRKGWEGWGDQIKQYGN